MQDRQVDSRLLGLYVPTAHFVQVASAIVLQLPPHDSPAWQTRHPAQDAPPEVLLNLPFSQVVHPRFCEAEEYVPGPHWLHARFVVELHAPAWKLPAPHDWQVSQPDFCIPVWYVPVVQEVHRYPPPVAVVKVPATHAEQTPSLIPLLQPLDQYRPAPHAWHVLQYDEPV
jgi:hypothetical protein